MKISARNQLKGIVVDVVKGATTSHVRIDIGNAIITASITNAAVDELGLAKGKTAIAVDQSLRRHGRHRVEVATSP
jgi:molybdopterin-binding protein